MRRKKAKPMHAFHAGALPRVQEHADAETAAISARGQQIVDDLPPSTKRRRRGQFVAVDVDTGRRFFSASVIEASRAARTAAPTGRIYIGRVGERATYSLGL